MWLVYLRLDGKGETRVSHWLCYRQDECMKVVEDARKFGAAKEMRLSDYAIFQSESAIEPKGTNPDPLQLEIAAFVRNEQKK